MGTSDTLRRSWHRFALIALCTSAAACEAGPSVERDADAVDVDAVDTPSPALPTPTPMPDDVADAASQRRERPGLAADDQPFHIDPAAARWVDAGPSDAGSDAARAPDVGDASADHPDTAGPLCAAFDVSRRCVDEHTLRICTSYFDPEASVVLRCAADERCAAGADGVARCAPGAGCRAGSSRCSSSGELERCVDGVPIASPCAGSCVGGTLGAACVPSEPMRTLTGTLRYSRRPIADDLLQWAPAVVRPARGFAVQVRRGAEVLARAVSDGDGRFSLAVPSTLLGGERIEAVAADGTDGHLAFVVADPAFGRGQYSPDRTVPATVTPWTWSWALPGAATSTFEIPLAASPAAAVFDDVRDALATVRDALGSPPRDDLVVWVGLGVTWTCGSCFYELSPIERSTQRFDAQIWLNGSAGDEEYWSAAVTLHELGHYVMAAWGTPVWEGGAHFLGVPTMPGQAWSEGWATWVSSALRHDPRSYAVADGTFYWWNIDARTSFGDAGWTRPTYGASLLQRLDENEVSAMLWSLSQPTTDAGAPDVRGLLQAIALPRMTTSPFARCYTRHVWTYDGYEYACATTQSTPHLADYLDALRCAGASADAVSRAIGAYPFPVDAPICEGGPVEGSCPPANACGSSRPGAPLRAWWTEQAPPASGAHALIAHVAYPGDLGVPAAVTLTLPDGATLREGPRAWTLRPGERRDVAVRVDLPDGAAGPVVLQVEVSGTWGGARAAIPWWAIAATGLTPVVPTRASAPL